MQKDYKPPPIEIIVDDIPEHEKGEILVGNYKPQFSDDEVMPDRSLTQPKPLESSSE